MKIEANVTTGEIIEREMTEAEIAQDLADQEAATERDAAEATKAADKAALLVKLGITEDEAKLLLS
jgi:hypothetical protein